METARGQQSVGSALLLCCPDVARPRTVPAAASAETDKLLLKTPKEALCAHVPPSPRRGCACGATLSKVSALGPSVGPTSLLLTGAVALAQVLKGRHDDGLAGMCWAD